LLSWGTWDASWAWSLVLVAATIAIHALGVVLIASIIESIRGKLLRRRLTYLDSASATIALIVAVALSLAILHALESMAWAVVYVSLGAVPSPADAALYSVDSMTTRGASGLVLERQWRMMGAAEAGDGMLLFGISTAFLFYVMLRLWKSDAQPR
jgi:hypothetical protein